jgi:hypothetical protein
MNWEKGSERLVLVLSVVIGLATVIFLDSIGMTYMILVLIGIAVLVGISCDSDDNIGKSRFTESAKTMGLGMVVIIVGCWFWHYDIGNPLNELALIRRAQIATGSLIETGEHEHESQNRVAIVDDGLYTYRLPDGREFQTTTEAQTGQLNEQVEVEYLPDNPAVSRVKGDGCASVTEWLWRKVGIGSLFLALCSSPGIILVKKGLRELRDAKSITQRTAKE